ncbi:unnamed protein product, partial [Callosobruchus maculatus]
FYNHTVRICNSCKFLLNHVSIYVVLTYLSHVFYNHTVRICNSYLKPTTFLNQTEKYLLLLLSYPT